MLSLGYAFGTFGLALERTGAPTPIEVFTEDIHVPVPLVHIREINNGSIIGTVGTGARLVIGETIVVASADTSFRIPAVPLLTNIIDVPIPHGAMYVASKRGKKYYDVTSSAGANLAPENRLYFQTAAEAEAMGYTASK